MFIRDKNFVHLVLQLSADHEPEGWPAIKMKDLMEAAESIKSLSRIIEMDSLNWADSHTHVEQYYLKYFPVPDDHKSVEEMVDELMSLMPAPNPAITAPPSGGPVHPLVGQSKLTEEKPQ